VLRSSYAAEFEAAGGVAEPFPGQVIRSMTDGVNHLGGDEHTPGVDPEREFMPAGQGIGAIDELVPAGELVHRFVAEAEAVLGRVGALR
jgi:enoyl-[acyl-carrier protein] reductase II